MSRMMLLSRSVLRILRTAVVLFLVLPLSPTRSAQEDITFCSNDFASFLEFLEVWSIKDPEVSEAIEQHGLLCRKVRVGELDEEAAAIQFRPVFIEVLMPLVDEIKEKGELSAHLKLYWASNVIWMSYFVGKESVIYFTIISIVLEVLVVLAIFASILQFTLNYSLGLGIKVLQKVFESMWIVCGVCGCGIILMVLSAVFLPVLEIVGIVFGIIGTIIGIAVGIKKLVE